MRYLIEPRDVKDHRFLSFAKNIGKNLSSRYVQKVFNSTKIIRNRWNQNCFKKGVPKNSTTNWSPGWK